MSTDPFSLPAFTEDHKKARVKALEKAAIAEVLESRVNRLRFDKDVSLWDLRPALNDLHDYSVGNLD